jgi:hypothetical protein
MSVLWAGRRGAGSIDVLWENMGDRLLHNLTPRPPRHATERGRTPPIKSPLHRMETYTQHTRDYRGEVNRVTLPPL